MSRVIEDRHSNEILDLSSPYQVLRHWSIKAPQCFIIPRVRDKFGPGVYVVRAKASLYNKVDLKEYRHKHASDFVIGDDDGHSMKRDDQLFPQPDETQIQAATAQLEENQRVLDYDTKEFTIELLVQKFEKEDIFVPAYQRRFNWDVRRQSRFIESVLIGLPIPFLFFADLQDGRLEVVDGRQRLSTCKAFLANDLVLTGLERLEQLNGFRFDDLSKPQQRRFKNRTIRSVVLSQKASEDDRRDLFDRINTGSLLAEPAETRRGSISGPITDLIDELASDETFQRLCPMSEAARRTRDGEELITRFFAFGDGLHGYRDYVTAFLNEWLRNVNERAINDPAVTAQYRDRFNAVMGFVEAHFPHGFQKKVKSTTTPRVRFDAIAVGCWMALRDNPTLMQSGPRIPVGDWLSSDDFLLLTTSSAANVRSRIENRTEYVKYMLSGDESEAKKRVPSGNGQE